MLGSKLNHVGKRGPTGTITQHTDADQMLVIWILIKSSTHAFVFEVVSHVVSLKLLFDSDDFSLY